jgi:short-subunit dehydrogenase
MEIKNSHILVTGSNRGIGKAFVEMCAQNKAHLHLANRTNNPELKENLIQMGAASVTAYDLDLGSKNNIHMFLQKVSDQPIDILFNNAGQLTGGLIEEQPIDDIYDMLQVNVNALIHLSHGLIPQMLKRGRGKIINNSSVSGVMNIPCASTYSASKAAVVAFTNCIQAELRGTGVSTLLLITPGVDTRMYQDIPKKYGKNLDLSFLSSSLTTQQYAEMIKEAILEDHEVLKPQGSGRVGLFMAQHFPQVFNRAVGKKFKRV